MTIKLQDIYGLAAVDIGGPIQLHDPAKTYTAGDIVVQGGNICQAKGAVPAGAFDATQWNHAAWDKDIREKISADIDLYVRPGGNDANAGLIDDDAHALASINAAFDRLTDFDLGAYNANINVAAGDYPAEIKFEHALMGGKTVFIKGAGVASTTLGPVRMTGIVHIEVTGVTFKYFGSYNEMVYASNSGSHLELKGCTFDSSAETNKVSIVGAQDYARIDIHDPTIVFGTINLQNVISATDTGKIVAFGVITHTGTAAVSNGYCYCKFWGSAVFHPVTAINGGTVTGPRFWVSNMSIIFCNVKGLNFLPGSVAGNVETTTYGIYIP